MCDGDPETEIMDKHSFVESQKASNSGDHSRTYFCYGS
jgi:hypothetical protein